jgi:hypothetical protein
MNLAPCAPILLAQFEENGVVVNLQALEVLRTITREVSVVGVYCLGGEGNSTLCNHLLQTRMCDFFFFFFFLMTNSP